MQLRETKYSFAFRYQLTSQSLSRGHESDSPFRRLSMNLIRWQLHQLLPPFLWLGSDECCRSAEKRKSRWLYFLSCFQQVINKNSWGNLIICYNGETFCHGIHGWNGSDKSRWCSNYLKTGYFSNTNKWRWQQYGKTRNIFWTIPPWQQIMDKIKEN